MKLRIYRTLFCAAFMLSSPAFADTPPSQGPVASIKEQSLRKDIAFLASDELQGTRPLLLLQRKKPLTILHLPLKSPG